MRDLFELRVPVEGAVAELAAVRATSAGRGNLLYCVTGTSLVLTLYSEFHAQVPLSRLEAFHGLCVDGAFIGRDLCHQAFGPLDAEDVVFSSNPGGISVSRPRASPPDRRKHLVGHLRNVSTRSLVIIIFTSLHGDRFRRPLTLWQHNHSAEGENVPLQKAIRREGLEIILIQEQRRGN